MKLKIADTEFLYFNRVDLSLNYDAIASAFSFEIVHEPNNPLHKELFRPDQMLDAKVIDDNGRTLITGNILTTKFKSSRQKHAVQVSGYTYTGALEDCQIPSSIYPLQVQGLSLYDICQRICAPFGIEVVLDESVYSRATKPFTKALSRDTDDIKAFLCQLAYNRQILITHNAYGDLVLTEAKTDVEPIIQFENGADGVEMDFTFNGQHMHSNIEMQRQQDKKSKTKTVAEINNPYVQNRYRPSVKKQMSGDNMENINTSVRNALSEELKGIELTIRMNDWYYGDKILITPNTIISVVNPELYIYKPTNFFIENVSFRGTSQEKSCTLRCRVPEVYNSNDVKNIFD